MGNAIFIADGEMCRMAYPTLIDFRGDCMHVSVVGQVADIMIGCHLKPNVQASSILRLAGDVSEMYARPVCVIRFLY